MKKESEREREREREREIMPEVESGQGCARSHICRHLDQSVVAEAEYLEVSV
jgi:hypothetical protein